MGLGWKSRITLSFLIIFYYLHQANAAESPAIRVKLIEIEGNERIEESTIRFYIQTKVGDEFSVSRIREDIVRIYQLGFFTDVRVDVEPFEGGLKVTYIVKEQPLIRQVTLTGNKEISQEDIVEKLSTKPRSVLNRNLLREDVERIKALYQERGYYFAEVQTQIIEAEGNQVEVTFEITEGEKVRIKRIAFSGNRAIEDDTLKTVMETKEGGLFSFLTGSGIYRKEVLRDDLRRIEALYQDRGFLQVQIGEPQVEINKEEREIFITIPIVEGEQFRIGKLRLEGDEVYSADELRRVIRSREGEVFDRSQLGRDVLRLSELYSQKGYAFADVIPLTQNDLERKLVNIEIQIQRGPQVYVGEIRIRGNEVTRDKVIRREMRFDEGELFNSAKLQRSRQRIFNTRFFEEVKVETQKRPQENIVDIQIEVKERPTGTFTAGAAFSSQDGLLGVVSISEANLFGRGQRLRLLGQLGFRRSDFELSFLEPYFLDRPVSATLTAFNRRRDVDSFTSRDTGAGFGFGKEVGEFSRFTTQYLFQVVNVGDIASNASQALRDEEGTSTTSSVTGSFTYDTRDNFLNPTSGSRTVASTQLAVLGGSKNFYKVGIETAKYFRVFRDLVLVLRGASAFGEGLFDTERLPLFERFFLGGNLTVRGFRFQDIGPKDPNGDSIGGASEVFVSAQFELPIGDVLKGVAFLDMGNVYDDGQFDPLDLRKGAGVGIRFTTPLGPVSLDWGFKLDRKRGEDPSEVHFQIGSVF